MQFNRLNSLVLSPLSLRGVKMHPEGIIYEIKTL